jgi:hypothetical protein
MVFDVEYDCLVEGNLRRERHCRGLVEEVERVERVEEVVETDLSLSCSTHSLLFGFSDILRLEDKLPRRLPRGTEHKRR